MPLAGDKSRMDAPSYPFSQKTSVACARISARRRSYRVAGTAAERCRRAETRDAVEGLAIYDGRNELFERSFELKYMPNVIAVTSPRNYRDFLSLPAAS